MKSDFDIPLSASDQRDRSRRRKLSKRRHAPLVRSLADSIAWLDAPLRWHEGRVEWRVKTPVGARPLHAVHPVGAMFSAAANALRQLEYHLDKRAAATLRALRDVTGADFDSVESGARWLHERHQKLDAAKRLSALHAPDLPALVKPSRAHNPAAATRLVALLEAEMFCADLPALPSRALPHFGSLAQAPLQELERDFAAPWPARALAALLLGVLETQPSSTRYSPMRPSSSKSTSLEPETAWLQRCAAWGRRYGLPDSPALAVLLLRDDQGTYLRRCQSTLQTSAGHPPMPSPVTPALLHELLLAGVLASGVVTLAEAPPRFALLAQQIVRRPNDLPDYGRARRRVAQTERRRREETLAALASLLRSYVRATLDPTAAIDVINFAHAMLGLMEYSPALGEAMLQPLRAGRDLPPRLQRAWLSLLVEQHGILWDTSPDTDKYFSFQERPIQWFQWRWWRSVEPALTILHRSGDPELARSALELGLSRELSDHIWHDWALVRWLLGLARVFYTDYTDSERWRLEVLCELLHSYGTLDRARAALGPVVAALRPAEAAPRGRVFRELLQALPETRTARHDILPRLAPFLPALLHATREVSTEYDDVTLRPAAQALFVLHEVAAAADTDANADADTARLSRRLHGIIAVLNKLVGGRHVFEPWFSTDATRLAATLAPENDALFIAIFRLGLDSRLGINSDDLTRGLQRLADLPSLRLAMARGFARRPRHCIELLTRLALVGRLGETATTTLRALECRSTPWADNDATWLALRRLAPNLAAPIADYHHATRLRGENANLPAGLRRVVQTETRLRRELAHLERRCAEHPETLPEASPEASLAKRMENLRRRLADRDKLNRDVAAEAAEVLVPLAAEAMLDAAAAQLRECYRGHLRDIAGAIAPDLKIDDDLTNAVLLSLDIRVNRRLLRRLLRAHLDGDTRWFERHPINAKFLETLRARGVDVERWLSASPCGFRLPAAAGGLVSLHLERDPLRVLQMGNLFGTCLSLNNINAFSTVANAVELNKRVIYARDGRDRTVGRQLIGLDREGRLVGFHMYASLSVEADNAALRAIFRRYVARFAARCGLVTANDGEVPVLFAQDWYDDGVQAWEDDGQTITTRSQ